MIAAEEIKLGIGMGGLEEPVTRYVREICDRFQPATYLEIGVALGQSLITIAQILRDEKPTGGWKAVGVELPNGYSFDRMSVVRAANSKGFPFAFVENIGEPVSLPWNRVTVCLDDAQDLIPKFWTEPIHLALIDGCHGKPCVIADFLNIEPFVPVGGIVMFHDFGADQVGHFQPHCSTGLDVIGACRELGLLDDKRSGWKLVDNLVADRSLGSWDMGIFRKEG